MRPPLRSTFLRRAVHSAAPRSRPALPRSNALVLGAASVAAASYLTWRAIFREPIHLDSPPEKTAAARPAKKQTGKASDAAPAAHASSTDSDTTAGPSQPKSASVSPSASSVIEEKEAEAQASVTDSEGGEGGGANSAAFNPETGEINWDCPCLGGMAHGPCGQEFRDAFSCFVFSEEEPKGINCVEKFQAMQNCFREHPEIYAEEIMDDDEGESSPQADSQHASDADADAAQPSSGKGSSKVEAS